jgi:ABC-2 type transport system permease protein
MRAFSPGSVKAVTSLALRTAEGQWTYRGAIGMSLASNGIALLVLVSVWSAAYDTAAPAAMPRERLIAYLVLAFIVNFAVSVMVDARLGSRILTGAVLFDISRPLGCMSMQLGQALGALLAKLLPVFAMFCVAWSLLGGAVLPPYRPTLLLAPLSFGLAFLVNFGIEYLAAQLLFSTAHFYGVVSARLAVHSALSGLFAPLELLPEWLGEVATWMPFRHVIETPVLVHMGDLSGPAACSIVAQQAVWAAALFVAADWCFRKCLTRLTIYGG